MQQTEFETLTGIYPDTTLYSAIELEYTRQTDDGRYVWHDKHVFCEAYKDNTDGLAEKIQKAANDEIWRKKENNIKLLEKNCAIIQKLAAEKHELEALLKEAEAENARLEEDCVSMNRAMQELKAANIKADMFDALRDAAHDDNQADTILHMLWGFEYLLSKKEDGTHGSRN